MKLPRNNVKQARILAPGSAAKMNVQLIRSHVARHIPAIALMDGEQRIDDHARAFFFFFWNMLVAEHEARR